jgi:hypothetical protein
MATKANVLSHAARERSRGAVKAGAITLLSRAGAGASIDIVAQQRSFCPRHSHKTLAYSD